LHARSIFSVFSSQIKDIVQLCVHLRGLGDRIWILIRARVRPAKALNIAGMSTLSIRPGKRERAQNSSIAKSRIKFNNHLVYSYSGVWLSLFHNKQKHLKQKVSDGTCRGVRKKYVPPPLTLNSRYLCQYLYKATR
jgi:hypothetical protein